MVAKGYTKEEGYTREKGIDSIAHLYLELHQMDSKKAFLNG